MMKYFKYSTCIYQEDAWDGTVKANSREEAEDFMYKYLEERAKRFGDDDGAIWVHIGDELTEHEIYLCETSDPVPFWILRRFPITAK